MIILKIVLFVVMLPALGFCFYLMYAEYRRTLKKWKRMGELKIEAESIKGKYFSEMSDEEKELAWRLNNEMRILAGVPVLPPYHRM